MDGGQGPIKGEDARQAIDSLGGYSYQLLATALAWLRLTSGETVFVEVAEDYAIAAASAVTSVQVKRTQEVVTLNSAAVKQAIDSFVALTALNPERVVSYRYLTTSTEGIEHRKAERIQRGGSLAYWRKVRSGADVAPLRSRLLQLGLKPETVAFINARDDARLVSDLISRISWECDQPNHPSLRQTVDDAFVEYGSAQGLPVQVCENMAAGAVAHILDISCQSGTRTLTFADFRRHYDRYAVIPVSLGNLLAAQLAPLGSETGASIEISNSLASIDDVPLPPYVASRSHLATAITDRLVAAGGVWLSAGTGYGKSLLARRCASLSGGQWKIARLRSTDPLRLPATLQRITTEIALSPPAGLIIDDLDGYSLPAIRDGLTSLLAYCRRLGVPFIVTANKQPSPDLSAVFGLSPPDLVSVGDFTRSDISEVVTLAGGADEVWPRYIELATGGGHPQLVHALVFDLKHRGWPASEVTQLHALTGQSTGLEATKTAARNRLVHELDSSSRTLLYRLSIAMGAFDRTLMFAIAGMDPALANPGELLDRMVGPWIDQIRANEYRLSPLVSNSGDKVLDPAERMRLHFTFAQSLTSGGSLDASKFDTIFLHGLLGKNAAALTKFSFASLLTSPRKLRRISEVSMLTSVTLDQPIYPDEPRLSVQLRILQLLMALSTQDPKCNAIWTTLQSEFYSLDEASQRRLHSFTLSKLLSAPQTADLIPNLPSLLVTLDTLCTRQNLPATMEAVTGGRPVSTVSMLFVFQLMETRTMSGLFALLNDFCDLPADKRALLCDAFDQPEFNISTAVKSAWAHAEKHAGFDAEGALDGYVAVAERLNAVGALEMAQAALETAAATADEYLNDRKRGLAILDRGAEWFGPAHGLLRTRARILYNDGQLEAFLQLAEPFMTDVANEDSLGRVYFSRDVGIARAKRGEWRAAADAFSIGEMAASESNGRKLRLMAIGFAADIAVAQWMAGDKSAAVRTLDRTLQRLESIDPTAGFHEVALYRLIGNTINYLFLNSSDNAQLAPEIQSYVFPGCNSSPSPHEGLKDGPLGHIDALWHVLADIEIHAGPNRIIADRVLSWPEERRLLTLGPMLVWKRWKIGIGLKDVPDLIHLSEAALDAIWFILNRQDVLRSENLEDPLRGPIPAVPDDALPQARANLESDLLVLATWLYLHERNDEAAHLLNSAAASPRSVLEPASRNAVFAETLTMGDSMPTLADCCGLIRRSINATEASTFEQVFVVGLRYLEASANFGNIYIAPPILAWSKRQFTNLIHVQSFRLRTPIRAVPAIRGALSDLPGGRRGLAALLLTALPWMPFTVGRDIAIALEQVFHGREL